MTDYCERFHIVKDMNGDGMFSISDVWLIIKFIWWLPAKAVVYMAQGSTLAAFFEVTCSTGESWGGGIFSLAAWFFAFVLIAVATDN